MGSWKERQGCSAASGLSVWENLREGSAGLKIQLRWKRCLQGRMVSCPFSIKQLSMRLRWEALYFPTFSQTSISTKAKQGPQEAVRRKKWRIPPAALHLMAKGQAPALWEAVS